MDSKLRADLANEQALVLRRLTPEQRIEAFIAHSEQVAQFYSAGQLFRRGERSAEKKEAVK